MYFMSYKITKWFSYYKNVRTSDKIVSVQVIMDNLYKIYTDVHVRSTITI